MNFFKLHLGDYLSNTGSNSVLEDGVYLRLLMRYYVTEKPLPVDQNELARIIRARSRWEVQALGRCVNCYFSVGSDGLLHNSRADKEIQQYQAQSATNREIARKRIVNESSDVRSPNQNQIPDTTTKGSSKHRDIAPGWWATEQGIEATAKTLGINPATKTYHELKAESFEKINRAKGNCKDKPKTASEPGCSQCGGTLSNGWTSMHGGRACNPCYQAYLNGPSTPTAPTATATPPPTTEDDDMPF